MWTLSIIVDQFTTAMASIQETLVGLSQKVNGQQGRRNPIQDEMLYDSLPPTPTIQPVNDIVEGDIVHMMRLEDIESKPIILDGRSCRGYQYFF